MATPTTKFLHGNPLMVDHEPTSDVTGGDVVVVGDVPFVAHNDIDANRLGAVAARGGVYDMPKATGSGEAIAGGKRVWWDAASSVVTTTSSGNPEFGYTTIEGSADGDATVRVVHEPNADTPA